MQSVVAIGPTTVITRQAILHNTQLLLRHHFQLMVTRPILYLLKEHTQLIPNQLSLLKGRIQHILDQLYLLKEHFLQAFHILNQDFLHMRPHHTNTAMEDTDQDILLVDHKKFLQKSSIELNL